MLRILGNLKSSFGHDRTPNACERRQARLRPSLENLEVRTLLSFVEMLTLYFNENSDGTMRGVPGFSGEGHMLGASFSTSPPSNSPIALHIGPGILTSTTNFLSFTTVESLDNKPTKVDLLENSLVTQAIQANSPAYQVTYVSGSAAVDNPTQPNDPVYEVTLEYKFESSVTLTNFTWNTDADGTDKNATHRGVNFTYTVSDTSPVSTSPTLGFYWASSPDPKDIISPAYTTGSSTPDTINLLTTIGTHGFGTDPFQDGNDPAWWGMPPAAATDILAIVNPSDLLPIAQTGKFDTCMPHGDIEDLSLPKSVGDVLNGSVVAGGDSHPADGVGAVSATDSQNYTVSTTFTVTVMPPSNPHTVIAGSSGNATTLTPFTRTGSFQDTTGTSPFKATVNYGDGTPILPLPLNSNNTFNLSHAYSTTGNYTVTVSVTDANGLTGTSHFVVTVTQPSSGLGAVPDAFVTTLYREVLGRSPELSGLRFWASKFIANARRATIVNAFFGSSERRSLVNQGVAPKITPRQVLADADRAAQNAKS